MARLQMKCSGARPKGEVIKASDWKKALRKWSIDNEPPARERFGDIRTTRRSKQAS